MVIVALSVPFAFGLPVTVTLRLVAGTGFTVCVKVVDVLVEKLVSPAYTAVIEWLPTLRDEIEYVAEPDEVVPLPKVVPPSLKVTFSPLDIEPPDTVAVKVSELPYVDGLVPEVNEMLVAVLALPTNNDPVPVAALLEFVTVKLVVPAGVVAEVVMVKVEEVPPPVTGFGENEAIAPFGKVVDMERVTDGLLPEPE